MNDALIAEGVLGRDADDFIKSELGRFLIARAKLDAANAAFKLKTTWPWRTRKIQQLQNEIWRAETFESWLVELIVNGKNAERIMDANPEG